MTKVPSLVPEVRVPDVPGDFLTDEGLASAARDCRRMAEYLMRVADGIDRMRGVTEETVTDRQPTAADRARELDRRAGIPADAVVDGVAYHMDDGVIRPGPYVPGAKEARVAGLKERAAQLRAEREAKRK